MVGAGAGFAAGFATQLVAYGVPVEPSQGQLGSDLYPCVEPDGSDCY